MFFILYLLYQFNVFLLINVLFFLKIVYHFFFLLLKGISIFLKLLITTVLFTALIMHKIISPFLLINYWSIITIIIALFFLIIFNNRHIITCIIANSWRYIITDHIFIIGFRIHRNVMIDIIKLIIRIPILFIGLHLIINNRSFHTLSLLLTILSGILNIANIILNINIIIFLFLLLSTKIPMLILSILCILLQTETISLLLNARIKWIMFNNWLPFVRFTKYTRSPSLSLGWVLRYFL